MAKRGVILKKLKMGKRKERNLSMLVSYHSGLCDKIVVAAQMTADLMDPGLNASFNNHSIM